MVEVSTPIISATSLGFSSLIDIVSLFRLSYSVSVLVNCYSKLLPSLFFLLTPVSQIVADSTTECILIGRYINDSAPTIAFWASKPSTSTSEITAC